MSDINAYQRILPCRHAYSRKMDKSAVRVFALDDILGVAFDGSTLLPADALWLPRDELVLRFSRWLSTTLRLPTPSAVK